MRSVVASLLVFALFSMVGCGDRSNPVITDPDHEPDIPSLPDLTHTPVADEAPAAETPATRGYAFRDQGEFPEVDVVFEEDDYVAAPEDVPGESLLSDPVREQPLREDVDLAPTVTTPVPPQPKLERRGFRVQLAASSSRTEAERVAREARNRLGAETYVVGEGRLYKVRAGDFSDRGEALELRDRAREYGYDEAWVVTTAIVATP